MCFDLNDYVKECWTFDSVISGVLVFRCCNYARIVGGMMTFVIFICDY